ncbi:MAG: hypothetical protein NC205_01715 [Prevotella sp.]|nr:hypothetical protein [Alistipes senegalensis]MCM1357284.1 hypothetical protein [Prevotella sp.]MCM1472977.1 hypothetical protein [Muribaculaceae bacterium]
MNVFSNGKNIPTYSFGNLFVQGEKFADTINISLERFYNNSDISGYKFMIVGLAEDDSESNQVIIPEIIHDNLINLKWNVSEDFTARSGKLRLELRAFEETDGEINTIIKYDMSPVNVKPTINGKNEPLPETNEQFINSMAVVTGECLEQLQNSVNSANVALQESINNFNIWVQGQINSFNLEETKNRLDSIEADTAVYLARPEVIPVTRSEYNSTEHKKNALYIITGEE